MSVPAPTGTLLVAVHGPDEPAGAAYTARRHALDQVLALVTGFLGAAGEGPDAGPQWTRALLHVPLLTVVRTRSGSGDRVPGPGALADLLTDVLLDAAGQAATPGARAAVADLAAGTARPGALNLVLTRVRSAGVPGDADAVLTHVVGTVRAAPDEPAGPDGGEPVFTVATATAVQRLDTDALRHDPAVATRWAQLMAGTDPDAVQRYPGHREITFTD